MSKLKIGLKYDRRNAISSEIDHYLRECQPWVIDTGKTGFDDSLPLVTIQTGYDLHSPLVTIDQHTELVYSCKKRQYLSLVAHLPIFDFQKHLNPGEDARIFILKTLALSEESEDGQTQIDEQWPHLESASAKQLYGKSRVDLDWVLQHPYGVVIQNASSALGRDQTVLSVPGMTCLYHGLENIRAMYTNSPSLAVCTQEDPNATGFGHIVRPFLPDSLIEAEYRILFKKPSFGSSVYTLGFRKRTRRVIKDSFYHQSNSMRPDQEGWEGKASEVNYHWLKIDSKSCDENVRLSKRSQEATGFVPLNKLLDLIDILPLFFGAFDLVKLTNGNWIILEFSPEFGTSFCYSVIPNTLIIKHGLFGMASHQLKDGDIFRSIESEDETKIERLSLFVASSSHTTMIDTFDLAINGLTPMYTHKNDLEVIQERLESESKVDTVND